MKKSLVYLALAVVAACGAVGVFVFVRRAESDAKTSDAGVAETRSARRIAEAKSARPKRTDLKKNAAKPVQKKPVRALSDENEKLSQADAKIAEELQHAMDCNDLKSVQKAVAAAMSSRNPILLKRSIEACRWFGEKALPELTAIAALGHELAGKRASSGSSSGSDSAEGAEADPEAFDEVVQDAMDGIDSALSEIESDSARAKLISEYMKTTSDEDMLTMLEGQLNGVPNEQAAAEAALDVIANGSAPAAEHAKEVYRFQTGEDYTTPEAAQQLLSEKAAELDAE